jgi:hypothetical protein
VVRTHGDPHQFIPAITEQLRQASGGFPVARVRTMDEVVVRSTARESFNMLLLTIFGAWRWCSPPSASTASWPTPCSSAPRRWASAWPSAPTAATIRGWSSGTACGWRSSASSIGIGAAFGLTRFIASFLFGVKSWDPAGLHRRAHHPHRVALLRRVAARHARRQARPHAGAAPKEPVDQSLIVEPSAAAGLPQDEALDKSIHFGNAYEYRAQRVARVTVGSQALELAGPLSEPVRVEAQDVFPPDVPAGLAAVATAGDTSASPPIGPSIDLSWQPVADPDIAGYVVYRREGTANWERISPMQALVGPGFHDAQVEAGHTYQYAVSAVDEGGRESAHSQPAEERVPAP